MAKLFYSIKEAAQKLSMTEAQVQGLIDKGTLQEFRDRDQIMLKVDQVDFFREHRDILDLEKGVLEIDEVLFDNDEMIEVDDDLLDIPPEAFCTGLKSMPPLKPIKIDKSPLPPKVFIPVYLTAIGLPIIFFIIGTSISGMGMGLFLAVMGTGLTLIIFFLMISLLAGLFHWVAKFREEEPPRWVVRFLTLLNF